MTEDLFVKKKTNIVDYKKSRDPGHLPRVTKGKDETV